LAARKAELHAARGYARRERINNSQLIEVFPGEMRTHKYRGPQDKTQGPDSVRLALATCTHETCIVYLDSTYGTHATWSLCLNSSLYSLRRLFRISQTKTWGRGGSSERIIERDGRPLRSAFDSPQWNRRRHRLTLRFASAVPVEEAGDSLIATWKQGKGEAGAFAILKYEP
jgi:hypothetical protein